MISITAADRRFLRTFAGIIAALHVVAGLLLVLSCEIYRHHPPEPAPDKAQRTAARIAPVGAVYSGATGRAAAEAEAKAQAASAPFGGAVDGKIVFDGLCRACHGAGVAGAPKVGDVQAWSPRISQGRSVLVAHAIEGFHGRTGTMPPRGGNAALSDAQVEAAVDWMVSQAK